MTNETHETSGGDARLESMLDSLGAASRSAGEAPGAFIGRVRRRRVVRRLRQASAGVLVMALAFGGVWITYPGTRAPEHRVYAVDWPPMADSPRAAPSSPMPLGIRPDDPRALAILQ